MSQSPKDRETDLDDGRDETLNERMDRNWNEMLQELRVTQTGTQVLTGFLLTIAFQPSFASLTPFQHDVYLVLVCTAALVTAVGLAPVNLHRGLFRERAKPTIVRVAHQLLRAVLAGVGLVLVGTVLLIFDVTVGRQAAYVAAGAMLAAVIALGALPAVLRTRSRSDR